MKDLKPPRWMLDAVADAEREGETALRSLRARFVQEAIEAQHALSEDKAGMLADRADFLSDGLGPREAQIRASAETDHDWRSRTTFASSVRQRLIADINGKISALQMARQGKKTPASQPHRICVAVSFADKTLADMAKFVQSWLDDGSC